MAFYQCTECGEVQPQTELAVVQSHGKSRLVCLDHCPDARQATTDELADFTPATKHMGNHFLLSRFAEV